MTREKNKDKWANPSWQWPVLAAFCGFVCWLGIWLNILFIQWAGRQ